MTTRFYLIIYLNARVCVSMCSTANTSLFPHVALTYCLNILFATHIRSTWKNPTIFSPLEQITISCINSFIRLFFSYNKSQRDAQLSQNLFDKVLYMFQTGPLSIIRSISTLYTRSRYLSC